ncbi:MAG: 3-hydroxyacyl-ACP dehydratase [Ferruginibacter sp.]
MLQGNFFDISNIETTGFDVKAELLINTSHKIFEGHFPGQPVVPGVCMMQMVKEILEKVSGKKTDLVKAHEMKFLALIDPQQNNLISAGLKYSMEENGQVSVVAGFFKDELTHFKFKGLFAFQ